MSAATLLLLLSTTVGAPAPSQDDVVDHLRAYASSWSLREVEDLGAVLYDHSSLHGLDPELVLAVMAVESSFRFRARSRVGALGLMQVMPSTGRLHARRAGVRWRGSRTLYDPTANIRIGTRYLAWLLSKFDGDLRLALTSYCHGIGKVKRTLRSQGRLSHRKLRYSRRVLRRLATLRKERALRDRRASPSAREARQQVPRRRRLRARL